MTLSSHCSFLWAGYEFPSYHSRTSRLLLRFYSWFPGIFLHSLNTNVVIWYNDVFQVFYVACVLHPKAVFLLILSKTESTWWKARKFHIPKCLTWIELYQLLVALQKTTPNIQSIKLPARHLYQHLALCLAGLFGCSLVVNLTNHIHLKVTKSPRSAMASLIRLGPSPSMWFCLATESQPLTHMATSFQESEDGNHMMAQPAHPGLHNIPLAVFYGSEKKPSQSI